MKGEVVLAQALKSAGDAFYTVPGYPVCGLAEKLSAECCINEKTALEYALGDSLAGRRAAVILKNVGLNACADTLVNATTQGLAAGVVIIVGDDPEAAGSQNTQDSSSYAGVARVPLLDPGAETIGEAASAAFEASELFSRIALLRVTPMLLESPSKENFETQPRRWGRIASSDLTMKGRAQAAESCAEGMEIWARKHPLNRGERHVVSTPPPPRTPMRGKPETMKGRGYARTLCPECPYHLLFSILRETGTEVITDIGCSLMAKNPPFGMGIASYGLGSAPAVAARAGMPALTGDFALLHSGMNALVDIYEKSLPLLTIVLYNRRMGMTGGQEAPDLLKYIGWTHPMVIDSDDEGALRELPGTPLKGPGTVIIRGECPEGARHGRVEL